MTPNYSRRDDPVKEPQYTTHISGVKSNTTVLCYCLGPYELVGEAFIYVQGIYIYFSKRVDRLIFKAPTHLTYKIAPSRHM